MIKKPLLIAIVALPMAMVGAGAGLTSDRALISDIQIATSRVNYPVTNNTRIPATSPTERRCPRRCTEELNLPPNINPQPLSISDTRERKGPRGPRGSEPAVRVVPLRDRLRKSSECQ